MGVPTLLEVQEALAGARLGELPPLRISVLRAVTVEMLEPYLRYHALRAGFDAKVRFGDYGSVFQEALLDRSPLLSAPLDVILVFMPVSDLSPAIAAGTIAPADVEQEVARVSSAVALAVSGMRRQSDAVILWHGLEPPLYPALGIRDAQVAGGQVEAIHRLNAALAAALRAVPDAFLVDMERCLARVGADAFYDRRYRLMARAPYKPRALAEIAAEDFKFIRGIRGGAKKCLVLDCDNTLWGGIVGEDGVGGIKIGQDYPGSAYLDFQNEIVNLHRRGVVLALCSKNNEADVWEVFETHPDMLLKRHHFAAWRINWNNKADNVAELAEELNLGLDSLVLADDNPFEIGLLAQHLPQVATLQLPQARPVEFGELLAGCGLFETPYFTDEDAKRGAMYRVEAERRRERAGAVDLDSYLQSLEVRVEFGFADSRTIARIAQQTQKTNQFNLTTRRYTEADITRLARSSAHDVLWMRASDRFGDLGAVGTAILAHDGAHARVDTLLMSCRALGRRLEQAFLDEIVRVARARGALVIEGEYRPTAKNAQVRTFYQDNGFSETDVLGDSRTFLLNVRDYRGGQPSLAAVGHAVRAAAEIGTVSP